VTADWLERRFGAEVTWLPFDLHPEYPPEGMPRARLRERYGEHLDAHLRTLFERHSLRFNPPHVMPNSRAALRVTELARDRGLHRPVHERLMAALWDEGRDLGGTGELAALATDAGLDEAEVGAVLAGDRYEDRVLASTTHAQTIGINGIPAFLLDGRMLILGAQPPEVFERALAELSSGRASGPPS
jgi:predicted DsbA family dithiol-disulfide isomerase